MNTAYIKSVANEFESELSELFRSTPVSFLSFCRFYKDRSLVFGQTNAELFDYYVGNQMFDVELSHRNFDEIPSGRFFTEDLIETKAESDLHSYVVDKHKLNNFVCFSKKYEEYCDIVHFAGGADKQAMQDFFLNYADLLEKYVFDGIEKFLEILQKNEAPVFKVSNLNFETVHPEQVQKEYGEQGKLKLAGQLFGHDFSRLTPQEMKCFLYAVKGLSSKLIGKKLGISFRTVEGHIERIKIKLGCQSKNELIARYKYL